MKLSARLLRLASNGKPYDPQRVDAIQRALEDAGEVRTQDLMVELWERFAEPPLTELDVRLVGPSDIYGESIQRAMTNPRNLLTVLDTLAIHPALWRRIFALAAEAEHREVAADGGEARHSGDILDIESAMEEMLRARAEYPVLLGLGPFQAAIVLETGEMRERATEEEADKLRNEVENTMYLQDPTYPDGTSVVQRALASLQRRERSMMEMGFRMLKGKSLRTLGLKNPFEPLMDLQRMGVQAVTRYDAQSDSNATRISLPNSVSWDVGGNR